MSENTYPDWVTSDSHWNHTKISEYCARTTPMCPRPEDIDELMRNNWIGLVRPNDTVLHLGDLGWFKGDEYVPWLADLPGNKLIVRGNHDDRLSTEWFAEHGFTEIEAPTYTHNGVEVLCTHYPQRLQYNQANICGHVHSNPTDTLTRKHLNVSVELWHYAPIDFRWALDKVTSSYNRNSSDYGPRNVVRKAKK